MENNKSGTFAPASIFRGFAEDKEAAGELSELYGSMPLKKHFRTYENVVGSIATIIPACNVLADVLGMMPFVWKPVYVPGVWLFRPEYPDGSEYSFSRDYLSIPFSKLGKKTNFMNSVHVGGKISYERYVTLNMIYVPQETGTMRFIQNVDTKNSVMASLVGRLVGSEFPIGCALAEPYAWPAIPKPTGDDEADREAMERVFAKVVSDAAERPETLGEYLADVDVSTVLMHQKILEDAFFLWGYLHGLSAADPK